MKVAVLLTCFNRKEKTLSCIESIYKQNNLTEFTIYVCDDNSSDGTKDAILKAYPNTIVIEGTGSLYWSRGMYKVMEMSSKSDYDYYLMINDDVVFFENMWDSMIEAFKNNDCVGTVGSTISKETGKQTYGGMKFTKYKNNFLTGNLITPSENKFLYCDLANWNCFLIDSNVLKSVGLINPLYEHSLGDFDYSLRMRNQDINIMIAKHYVGYCETNNIKGTFRDPELSFFKRTKLMVKPNGFPLKSWYHYTKTHYDKFWLKNFVVPYIRSMFCFFAHKKC